MPGTDRLGGAEAFQPAHRPQPGFQLAVIGLDPVVRPPGIKMIGPFPVLWTLGRLPLIPAEVSRWRHADISPRNIKIRPLVS